MKITFVKLFRYTILIFILLLHFNSEMKAQTAIWASQFKCSNYETVDKIVQDASGNVFVVGRIKDTCDFDPSAGVFNLNVHTVYENIFLTKLDSAGNLIWAKLFDGTAGAFATDLRLDAFGNLILNGYMYDSLDFDLGPNVYNIGLHDTACSFLCKLDSSGSLRWVHLYKTYLVSSMPYSDGSILTTGSINTPIDLDPGIGFLSYPIGGITDLFIQKLDSSGNFQWAHQIGDTLAYIWKWDMIQDTNGFIYAVGLFSGKVDFDPDTTQAFLDVTTTGFTGNAVALLKYDSNFHLIWAKSIGNAISPNDIELDPSNDLIIVGDFFGYCDFDPGTNSHYMSPNGILPGESDVFMLKLDSALNFKWALRFGENGNDKCPNFDIDLEGNLYLAGTINSTTDLDPDIQTTYILGPGGYLSKYTNDGKICWARATKRSGDVVADPFGSVYYATSFPGTWSINTAPPLTVTSAGNDDNVIIKMFGCDQIDTTLQHAGNVLYANAFPAKYQWYNCNTGLPISGETNQSFVATVSGDYGAIISRNGCSDSSMCYQVNVVTKVDDLARNENLILYPNPTKSLISIESDQILDETKVILMDPTGRTLYTKNFHQTNKLIWNDDTLAKGVYFISVSINKQQTKILKLLVE